MGEYGAKFLSEYPFKRSVNDNWDLFKENLVNSMKKNIPQKKVSSRWNLPWMTLDQSRGSVVRKREPGMLEKEIETAMPGKDIKNSANWLKNL